MAARGRLNDLWTRGLGWGRVVVTTRDHSLAAGEGVEGWAHFVLEQFGPASELRPQLGQLPSLGAASWARTS